MGSVEKVVAIPDGLITMDREGRLRRSDNRGRHWEDITDSERVIDIEANPGGGVLVLTAKGSLACAHRLLGEHGNVLNRVGKRTSSFIRSRETGIASAVRLDRASD
jgi:hypothetical protein